MKIQTLKLNYFQEIGETFKLLNYFLKFFALDFILTKGGFSFLHLIRMAIPVVIMGILNIYTLIYKFLFIINVQINLAFSVLCMDFIQSVYDLLQYFVDMWYVYKYGADVSLEYINRYCYMDSLLGMEYTADIKRMSAKFLCFIFTSWSVVSVCDFLIWAYSDGPIVSLYFLPAYIHKLIKCLTSVHLSLNIVHIESRLRTIGDHVQTLYANSENLHPLSDDVTSSTWFYPYSKNSVQKAVEYIKAKKYVKWFSCYYLSLSEQVHFINRMFGMRILLNTLSLLIEMIRLLNIAVRILVGSQKTGASFYPALGSLIKLLMSAVMLIYVVSRSEKAYEQRTRLQNLIDNLFVNKKIDENIVDDIKEFHSLIQARPISFSMAYFVRIDNSVLVSIASAFVTYSIILLQSVN